MALLVVTADTPNMIGTGIKLNLESDHSGIIAAGAVIASTDSAGVSSVGSNQSLNVQGSVFGEDFAIDLGAVGGTSTGQHLSIGDEGYAANSNMANAAVLMRGTSHRIDNAGTIHGENRAVEMRSGAAAGVTYITNSGLIEATTFGIVRTGGAADIGQTIIFTNTGELRTANEIAYQGNNGSQSALDVVHNSGLIVGDVRLGVGDDYYYGTGGRMINGSVSGYDGLDTMVGGDFEDLFSGGNDADTLNGGSGNDRLWGDSGKDKIFGEAGDDTLNGGSDADVVSGGAGADDIYGESDDDKLHGDTGNDYLDGSMGEDELFGGDDDDDLRGGVDDDDLNGDAGSDTLRGGTGADALSGGDGDDLSFGDAGDDVVNGDAGNDTLNGDVGKDTLSGGLGDDQLNGGDDEDTLSGDAGNDALNGGLGKDTMSGGLGDDQLLGSGGDDSLKGEAGNDTLNGGGGADGMDGGAGNDTFVVENAGDAVSDTGGGIDRVVSVINFSLADAVHVKGSIENLALAGSASLNGTGNALANTLTGNVGNNTLKAGAGSDTVNGSGGNDRLFGEAGNDVMSGGVGADRLAGGLGVDKMTGGAQADQFVFDTKPLGLANRDTVTDFQHNVDKLLVDDAVFKGIGAAGALNADFFHVGAAAHDANDRIVYNKATGVLSYDADGTGASAAVQCAVLANKAVVSASDFLVI